MTNCRILFLHFN